MQQLIFGRSKYLAGALLLSAASALPADSSLPCEDIGLVFALQAMLASVDAPVALDPSALLSQPESCEAFVNPAQSTLRCVWPYSLGAPEAWSTYQAYVNSARACVGPLFSESESAPVNHPDAYYATYFSFRGTVLAVTLKNKSALQRTLVAVRVED